MNTSIPDTKGLLLIADKIRVCKKNQKLGNEKIDSLLPEKHKF